MAEALAAVALMAKGYLILGRNVKTRGGRARSTSSLCAAGASPSSR
ncbi:MAG: hypothetical protein WDN31_19785 [Hyphomicrobium sp.]